MSFLDTNGLTYFYSKLKEKFIRSVNSITPDINGNVVISNVDTANNLTSPDAQASYGEFIYRTSGGTASLTSGEAQIAYVDGNVRIDGRIPESFQFTGQNGIIVSEYSADIWRSEIDTTGAYNFSYTKPTSDSSTSEWSPQIGTWSYNENQVNLNSYGLTVVNIIAPSLSITTNSSSISSIDITPSAWMSQISESGDYTFVYSATDLSWFLNSTPVTLSTYGIDTNNAIPTDEDEIYVSYNAGTPTSILTVNYIAAEQGTIVVATPTAFKATGFNQFNNDSLINNNDTGIINNAIISNGQITNAPSSGHYVCYVHAVGGVERGYVAYSETGTIRNIGWCENFPQSGESVVTTDSSVTNTISSILFPNDGYVVVEVTSYNDLCIHPRWSTDDETYEAYVLPSVKEFPTEDIEGTALPIGIYGMPAVGTIADRLDFDTGVYIKRIERIENNSQNMTYVQGLEVSYDWDSNYIYYVRPTPLNYIVDVNPIYTVNDFGTEEFVDTEVPLKVQLLYGQNLRDKLRTDVVTISEQSLSANQKTQVCTNIGAVNKIGDTMTGNLTMSAGNKVQIRAQFKSNGEYTANQYAEQILLQDSAGTNVGYLRTVHYWESENEALDLIQRREVNGTTVYNSLQLAIKSDGARLVTVTDPAPWRTALNTVSKSGDTFTGLMRFANQYTALQSSTLDVKTNPSGTSVVSHQSLTYRDKNDKIISYIGIQQNPAGAIGMFAQVNGYKTDGTRSALDFMRWFVDRDGKPTVYFQNPSAWRSALGFDLNTQNIDINATKSFSLPVSGKGFLITIGYDVNSRGLYLINVTSSGAVSYDTISSASSIALTTSSSTTAPAFSIKNNSIGIMRACFFSF